MSTDYDQTWELAGLTCPAGHEKKLAIMRGRPYRFTYCPWCARPVYFSSTP